MSKGLSDMLPVYLTESISQPGQGSFFLRLAQLILYFIVNLFHEFVQRKYGGIGFAVQSVGNSLAFLFLEAKYD